MAPHLRLLRPFTLLAPMLGMLTGAVAAAAVVGVNPFGGAPLSRILLGMVMAATLNAASNTLNQIFDLEQDRLNKPHRPLPNGDVSIRSAAWIAAMLYVAANVMAWFIDHGAGRECFVIVAFTTFLTYAYSGPPLRWRRFGWRANLTIAVPRGLLLKVAGWSCVAPVFSDVEPWYLGSVFGLFLLGATTTKDLGDVEGDREYGVRNLPVRLGPETAIRRSAPFFVLPWLLLPLGAYLPGPVLSPAPGWLWGLGLACAAYGAWIVRLLLRPPESSRFENHPAWRHMYALMMFAQVGSAAIYHR